MTKTLYIGWIPTISGNLSFSEIGNTKLFKKFMKINAVDTTTNIQSIALFGKRDLNDGVLAPKIRELFGTKTEFEFGLLCYSQSKSRQPRALLRGIIYFTTSKAVQPVLARFARGNIGDLSQFNIAANSIKRDTNIIKWAEVEIKRNGQCSIEFDGEANNATEEIANQFFFFARDACHHHYHHNSKSDSITKPYKCRSADDPEWRFETIYALHRSIIAARRYNSEKQLNMSKGISAYARTFEQKFLTDPTDSEGKKIYTNDHGFEPYKFDEALYSIDVRLDEVRKGKSELISNIGVFIPVFLASLAICVSFSQLEQFKTHPLNPYVKWFGTFSIDHPVGLSAGFAAIVMGLQILIFNESPLAAISLWLPKKQVLRLVALPKALLVMVLFATTVAFWILSAVLYIKLIE